MKLSDLSSEKYRWWALVFLAIGLAIVIIDNSVLNVAIPYILRDLQTSFDAIQWVISGYALIIATILITVGRVGDIFGRKKIFMLGTVLFAIGSFVASISHNAGTLFLGEAFIEAIGAAMMLTSSLSLLVSEFHGKERAIAFGVWGSVAGASAALGPLLGGYFTAYHSWRWALRINVFVAIVAILGMVFVQESKSDERKNFDWWGTLFSGIGLFSLVFALIEGQSYGWWHPNKLLEIGQWQWALANVSIIPFAILLAVTFLGLFVWWEYELEKTDRVPLVRPSMFKSRGFSMGLVTLLIVSLGQFGSFFILPIFLQNVLGLNAFNTGLIFLASSISIFIFGPLSGILAAKFSLRWVVIAGMFLTATGILIMGSTLKLGMNPWLLAPGLFIFGMGVGGSGAQLTNVVLSNVPPRLAGEASAVNNTIRQVGTAVGIAILGMVLASTLQTQIVSNVNTDQIIPAVAKHAVVSNLQDVTPESGQQPTLGQNVPIQIKDAVKLDVNTALVSAARRTLHIASIFLFIGAITALFIPVSKPVEVAEGSRPPAVH